MGVYFNSILTISVIGGIIISILPESSRSLKKYVKYIVGLICAITLLSPITSVINNITSFKADINNFFDSNFSQEAINESNSLIINLGSEKVGDGIKSILIERYKLSDRDIIVNVFTDTSDIASVKISKISITLKGKATWEDSEKIKNYLEEMLNCEIEVKKK